MAHNILVAYATKHGSTREIAEVVANTLREAGLQVDVQPAAKVRKLNGYAALVLGAPLYMFHWHKDALQFLSRFQSALRGGLPIAIFAGGPMEPDKPEQFAEVRTNLEQELVKFTWLKPASVEIVGGKFDPLRLSFPYNLLPALKQMPASDLRDWDLIRTWAAGLVEVFGFKPDFEKEEN